MSDKVKILIDKSDLVGMADAIRSVIGSSDEFNIDELTTNVKENIGGENLDEVLEDQDDIIAQIQTALQGKASGGGGGSVETCTLNITVTHDYGYVEAIVTVADSDGIHTVSEYIASEDGTVEISNIVIGSYVILADQNGSTWICSTYGAEVVMGYGGSLRAFEVTGDDGHLASITTYSDDMPPDPM